LQIIGNLFRITPMMDMSGQKIICLSYVSRLDPKHAEFAHTCPKIPVDLFGDFWYRIGA
jgi:hypothetical protein